MEASHKPASQPASQASRPLTTALGLGFPAQLAWGTAGAGGWASVGLIWLLWPGWLWPRLASLAWLAYLLTGFLAHYFGSDGLDLLIGLPYLLIWLNWRIPTNS